MVGIAAALVAATVSFGLSLSVANPIDSFCVRLAPRALSVAGAALFCVVVLLRHRREAGSSAYGVAGLSYLVHALVGTLYGVAATGRLVAGSAAPLAALFDQDAALRPSLFLFDIVSAYGICLGMVLLLIEDFQRSTQALEESLRLQKEALDENAVLQAEISERRRMESALRVSEAKFAAAFKAAPCGIAISRWRKDASSKSTTPAKPANGVSPERGHRSHLAVNSDFGSIQAERADIVAHLKQHGKVCIAKSDGDRRAARNGDPLFGRHDLHGRATVLSVGGARRHRAAAGRASGIAQSSAHFPIGLPDECRRGLSGLPRQGPGSSCWRSPRSSSAGT